MLRQRRRVVVSLASVVAALGVVMTWAAQQQPAGILPGTKVYIAPMNDFELFLRAAIYMKEVPVVILADRGLADCEITGSLEAEKTGRASLRVVDLRSSLTVFAYEQQWKKEKQDLAIDFAKQLKKRIEQNERQARKSAPAKPSSKPEGGSAESPPPQPKVVVAPATLRSSEPQTTTPGTSAAQQATGAAQPPRGPEPASATPSVQVSPTVPATETGSGASAVVPSSAKITTTAPLSKIVCPEGIRQVPFSSSRPDRRTIPCGELVTIIGGRAPWIRVRTGDGLEGSVSSRFLER
jgi:hypothetical protein